MAKHLMGMFQTEIEEGSFVGFFLQQVGVCVASVFWGAISAEWLARLGGLGSSGSLAEAIGNVGSGLGLAFLLGRLSRSKLPRFVLSGRWVWLLPSAFFVAALVSSALHSRLERDLSEFLFPRNGGEGLWAVVVFSYPSLGCVGYSLGIGFARPQIELRKRTVTGPKHRAILVAQRRMLPSLLHA